MEETVALLRGNPLFRGVSDAALSALAPLLARVEFPAGATILRQGDPGDALYVIASGRAEVVLVGDDGAERSLATLGDGSVAGEMAVVTGAPRNTDLRATTAVAALRLAAADYHALVPAHPDLGEVMTGIVADRLGRAPQDGLADKVLAGYRIRRPVGRGATGVVYEAVHLATGETVAVKLLLHSLLAKSRHIERFRREYEIARRVDHPGVARARRLFEAYGTFLIEMEFCDGPSLDRLLARGRPPLAEALRIAGSAAAALLALHEAGVVHADLKPANVMFTSAGAVKLADFGLASVLEPGRREDAVPAMTPEEVSGTPRYMAPEQFQGTPPGRRTDLYALGAVLHELLTGRKLFPETTLRPLLVAKFTGPNWDALAATAGLDPAIAAIVRALTSIDPAAREVDLAPLVAHAGPA